MKISKTEIVQKLYEIAEKQNMNLDKEVQLVIRNEIIPIEVIKLINRYDKQFLQIYETYNRIFQSRFKNPLYRNLRDKDNTITEEKLAIALSSLVTRILITCSKIESISDRQIYAKAMNIEGLNTALTLYSIYNNSEGLFKLGQEIKELLTILYEE